MLWGLGDVTLKTVMRLRQDFEKHLSTQGTQSLLSLLCSTLCIVSL